MMDWKEVERRIGAGEDDRTEFNPGIGDLKPIGRAIAAFANSEGEVLVLGVDDAGAIVGVHESAEKVSERLTAFLQTGLNGPVQAGMGRHKHSSGWVHWIEVVLGGNAPSRYLASIESNHGVATKRLDEILTTHLIAPALLRGNSFDEFIRHRARLLLDMVEKAMGKAVVGRDAEDVVQTFGAALTNDIGPGAVEDN
jgi:hypothetical protein